MPIIVNSQPAVNQIVQRDATTGGTFNLGTANATFNVTPNSAGHSSFEYRVLDQDGVSEVSTWVDLGAIGGAAQDVSALVPANEQWYKIEFREDGANNIVTSNRFGVGRIVMLAGQSLGARFVAYLNDLGAPDETYASLGITPSDNSSVQFTYIENTKSHETLEWSQLADSTDFDGIAVAQFLNDQIAEYGVNCSLAGHCRGGAFISQFLTGGSQKAAFDASMAGAGGWELFLWFQGHSDAAFTGQGPNYDARLIELFGDIDAANSFAGYDRILTAVPNYIIGTGIGSDVGVTDIRYAQYAWTLQNPRAKYLAAMSDLEMYSDGVHPTQLAGLDMARHFHVHDVGDDNGPRIISTERVGAVITAMYTGNLTAEGDISKIYGVFAPGDFTTPLPISSAVIQNGREVVITLASDPGGPVEIWANFCRDVATHNDNIRGVNTTSYPKGPSIETSMRAFYSDTKCVDLNMTGDTYATSIAGFGQALDTGNGSTNNAFDHAPNTAEWTIEFRINSPLIEGFPQVFVGADPRFWFGINNNNQLLLSWLGYDETPHLDNTNFVITENVWHHIALVSDAAEVCIYVDGVRIFGTGARMSIDYGTVATGISHLFGGSNDFAGLMDDYALTNAVKYTGPSFTPSLDPIVGDEPDLWAFYKFDGDGDCGPIIIDPIDPPIPLGSPGGPLHRLMYRTLQS